MFDRSIGAGIATIGREFWADDRGWLLLVVSLGWLLTIGTRIVYPALLPSIRLEFGFGYATTGVVVGLVWAAYGLSQLPGGLLADLVSERSALLAGLSITVVGLLAVIAAPGFEVFLLATAVAGAGTGIYGPSRVTVLANAFPDNDSTAIAVSQAAGNVGNAILPVVAGVLAAAVGWRLGLGFLAPLLVLVGIGIAVVVPRFDETSPGIREIGRTAPGVLARPPVYASTALLLCIMLVYQSLTGFLPTYLVDVGGLSDSQAAALYGAFFAVAVVAQFAAGRLADRFGVQVAIGAFALASVPGFGLLLVGNGTWVLVVGVVLASALLGCFPPAHAAAVTVVPDAAQGTTYGAMRTVYIGLGATGPFVTGWLADAISLRMAFVALSAVVVVIVGINRLLDRWRAV